jgi:hypothetical protein
MTTEDQSSEYTAEELQKKSKECNRAAVKQGLTGRVSIPNTATESDRERAMEKVFGDNET